MLFLLSSLDAKVTLQSATQVLSDPHNETLNPKRIPGATIRYYFQIYNDSKSSMDMGRLTTQIDVGKFDLGESVIMIDTLGVLKSSRLDLKSGEVDVSFFSLKAQQKVVLYLDVVLKLIV